MLKFLKNIQEVLIIMKKLISVFALLILMAAPSFALSDAEYLKMKKNNQSFARADRKLTNVWNKLKKSLPEFVFEALKKDQREWIKQGRDNDAKKYIEEGYSRTEAYTFATNDRANKLPDIARGIMHNSEGYEPEEEEEEIQTEPGFPLNENETKENDNKGEIEEDRFKNSDSNSEEIIYEGNYTSRNGGFMTVLITNKNEMEAEVTISLKNPEVTWSSKGWIGENNVLELFDTNYSGCQANLTFSKNKVKIETSPDDDWNEILEDGVRLDGIYERN